MGRREGRGMRSGEEGGPELRREQGRHDCDLPWPRAESARRASPVTDAGSFLCRQEQSLWHTADRRTLGRHGKVAHAAEASKALTQDGPPPVVVGAGDQHAPDDLGVRHDAVRPAQHPGGGQQVAGSAGHAPAQTPGPPSRTPERAPEKGQVGRLLLRRPMLHNVVRRDGRGQPRASLVLRSAARPRPVACRGPSAAPRTHPAAGLGPLRGPLLPFHLQTGQESRASPEPFPSLPPPPPFHPVFPLARRRHRRGVPAATDHEDDSEVVGGVLDPAAALQRARRLKPGPALQEKEVRQAVIALLVPMRDHPAEDVDVAGGATCDAAGGRARWGAPRLSPVAGRHGQEPKPPAALAPLAAGATAGTAHRYSPEAV